jgi:hypothetical protein
VHFCFISGASIPNNLIFSLNIFNESPSVIVAFPYKYLSKLFALSTIAGICASDGIDRIKRTEYIKNKNLNNLIEKIINVESIFTTLIIIRLVDN